ncbi:MAG TPA: DUF1579 family protein [Thermoanaerobaculia bacterium]|nr:DUF1579 family protein [Thermoanaerobaculia bacterium]
MRRVTPIVFLLVLVAGSALAMDPNPELKKLDVFAHNYDCTGIAYASPMAPEHPTAAKVTGEWMLGGNWVAFSYIETKTAKNPMPFAVRGYWGYDAATKKFIMGGVDNMGSYATGSGDGWNGDAFVVEGPWHMGTQTVKARDTFTKTGPNTMTHVGEMEMDGTWVAYGKETCTRSK